MAALRGASLSALTREPGGSCNTSAGDSSPPLTGKGPLVGGPLDPLVRPGRVHLDHRARAWLEERWPAGEYGSFNCPLPGHSGRARLVDQDGDLRLGCCSGRWRSLGEVIAAEAYGTDTFRTNIEIATWTRRLAYEAGAFEPLDVPVPALSEGSSEAARRARDGFKLLIGLRWKDGPSRPVAFSVRFCSAWCQMSHARADEAVKELRRRSVIYEAGRKGRVRLYLSTPARDTG
jgi:hypothetical protein